MRYNTFVLTDIFRIKIKGDSWFLWGLLITLIINISVRHSDIENPKILEQSFGTEHTFNIDYKIWRVRYELEDKFVDASYKIEVFDEYNRTHILPSGENETIDILLLISFCLFILFTIFYYLIHKHCDEFDANILPVILGGISGVFIPINLIMLMNLFQII